MGINVSSLSPTQAREYWYDYNNGNKKGLSDAEYATLCTRFKDYIKTWEQDENDYGYKPSPQDSLDYDSGDAGFFGDGKGVQSTVGTGVIITGSIMAGSFSNIGGNLKAIKTGSKDMVKNLGNGKQSGNAGWGTEGNNAAKDATELDKETISLLATAALQLAFAILTKSSHANEDAQAACLTAQDMLLEEQAILAEQILNMEEMQEFMAVLQAQAEAANEKGQDEIMTMEGVYHYYLMKYKNGTATENEINLLNALSMQMQMTQSRTASETGEINAEIAKVGEGYEEIGASIDYTNSFTEYVSEIDNATKTAAYIQMTLMTLSCLSAAATSVKCFARAAATNIVWFATAAYIAAGASAAYASYIFGAEAVNQMKIANTADDTRDIRLNTQDLSEDTTEFQKVSMEVWDETVVATDEDNLFTLTPTYAGDTVSTSGASDGAGSRGATGGTSTGFGGLTGATGGTPGGTTSGENGDDKDKDKDGKK